MRCPAPVDLVVHAFRAPVSGEDGAVAQHVNACASCLGEVRAMRETASVVRTETWTEIEGSLPSTACLTEAELAASAQGVGGSERDRSLAHLATCGACRRRLAALMRLLGDDAVAAELKRVGDRPADASRRPSRARNLAAAGTLAAAVVAAVLLRPDAVPAPSTRGEAGAPHRESAITTTAAPRILGPVGPASVLDALIWTGVPHAAAYRVRVFDRDGTLVWDARTSDTTLVIPSHLRGDTVNAYLWKVEARTGWDRWAASEWRDLVIRSEVPPR